MKYDKGEGKMTADERIEKLLSRFGQTISDLPKADGMHHVYDDGHRKMAEKTAYKWHKVNGPYFDMIDSVRMLDSYICHLSDVIDRMEIALETAANNSGCDFCEKQWNECKLQPNNEEFVCDYRIADEWLY